MKKKLVVSVSGGETSAYMAHYLNKNKRDEYDMIFVFANTGEENEETLIFIERIKKYFGIDIVWVEAVVDPRYGHGIRHRIVDYKTASRKGEPFEGIISKYGIPNPAAPYCSDYLKQYPINDYVKNTVGWKKGSYYTAIGIRADEIDRISEKRHEKKYIYPLVEHIEVYKEMVNFFWNKQPFRLDLKGYEGNCKVCWKKSTRKLATIAKNNPEKFNFFNRMQSKYENYIPEPRKKNTNITPPLRFYRNNMEFDDFVKLYKDPTFEEAKDDSTNYNFQLTFNNQNWDEISSCEESCEAFK